MNESAALDACAREPIQHSGAIQPHGCLLSCAIDDLLIRHVSANAEALLDIPTDELLGLPLSEVFETHVLDALAALAAGPTGLPPSFVASANVGLSALRCDVSAHVNQDLLHIELEPSIDPALGATDLAHPMYMLLDQADSGDLHALAAAQVRRLTGFERVMIYRFLEDGSGEVISESLAENVRSYLGLRYPASDIPPQARALYLRNRVRVIADTDYVPAPILPPAMPDGTPLDLSFHGLRSVSPVHLEYMRNMGMAASMSISIIVDGALWGLIACHHRAPMRVSPSQRAAADLFGILYSQRLEARMHAGIAAHRARATAARADLLRSVADGGDLKQELLDHLPALQRLIACDVVACRLPDGRIHIDAPRYAAAVADALAWLAQQPTDGRVLATDTRADWRAPDAADTTSGLLAIRGADDLVVVLLRDEWLEQVHWAGEPVKHLVSTDDGVRMAPRRSFALWKETMRGRSQPWETQALADAEALQLLLSMRTR